VAARTYKARALVLRKTKLGEKDLVITLIDERGMLLKGVAKGARRPGGSFAARLELFSEVSVLMAQGRSLDVIGDAKLIHPARVLTWVLVNSSCAAPLAELLAKIAQPDLEQGRVFEIARAAFALMGKAEIADRDALALCAASIWKVMAQIGFRPSFLACVSCGRALAMRDAHGSRALSVGDGGVVCDECRRPADALVVDSNVLLWCEALIRCRFSEIPDMKVTVDTLFEVLRIARLWSRLHVGSHLKSLDFLLSSGLFG